jgi:NADH-quinone oxidoreductase subunit G
MTVTTTPPPAGDSAPVPVDQVTLTIDGVTVTVPKGTLVIRAAELVGVAIPRFCDHPLLDPVGACRQCLVEVEGQRKPLASCTTTVSDGMVVRTQLTSEVADKAQQGVMEMLLVNHPLDCPVCDKGGECPLQNQAMSNGRGETRFDGPKRTFPKPIPLSTEVLLDRERCISCARCTRFAAQVAGDPFIELVERGTEQQVGIEATQPFDSYFAGNTVQICPVGALTGAAYRFRSRPFDLVSAPSACEHCASGCALRTDHRRGVVLRRMAGDDPSVNEEWNCDKGRWAFHSATRPDRIQAPMVRDADGTLVQTSWPDALDVAARGLLAAREGRGVGVLTGGRVTVEDAYAYAKLARVALRTNDVDFRARPHSAEEADFLAAHVAGRGVSDPATPTYRELEHAPAVVLVGLEPEEESPIVFLRLRKAARHGGTQVFSLAAFGGRALARMHGRLVATTPGGEAETLADLAAGSGSLDEVGTEAARLLREPGAVLLVGERLAAVPGALSAASQLAAQTGARLGWVPRRAGERGAVEAGALPGLLPGGRPLADAAARVDVGTVWAADPPAGAGRDAAAMLAAAAAGELAALVVGGVELDDLPDPAAALVALETVGFLVSLEVRASAVTSRADVVLPVASVEEKAGTFLSWEGRPRRFDVVLREALTVPDTRALSLLADAMGAPIGLPDPAAAAAELAELGPWNGARAQTPQWAVGGTPGAGAGEAVLATWRLLLDEGRLQDGEPYLAGTRHPSVARLSAATAAEVGVGEGELLVVSTDRGRITLPLEVTVMPDRVVWLPTNSPGSAVRRTLAADAGAVVRLGAGSGGAA